MKVELVAHRLAQAIRERDPILAVVRGSAANQDGRTLAISAPNARLNHRRRGGSWAARIGFVSSRGVEWARKLLSSSIVTVTGRGAYARRG